MDAIREFFEARGILYVERDGGLAAVGSANGLGEYDAIRSDIGVTDRRDLARVRVEGDGALRLLERASTGNIHDLREDGVRAVLFLSDEQRILTTAYVWCLGPDEYLVLGPKRDGLDLTAHLSSFGEHDASVTNCDAALACLSIEGPYAWRAARDALGDEIAGLRVLRGMRVALGGNSVLVLRVGATGEYGYACLCPWTHAAGLVERLFNVAPSAASCGTAIQNLLHLEVKSFNRDMDAPRGETPLEAGLHWMIDFRKEAYVGRPALERQKRDGVRKKLVGLCFPEGIVAAIGDVLYADGTPVGYVVNSGMSPRAGHGIAVAYVDDELAWVGVRLTWPAGSDACATIRSAPFVETESTRVRMT